MIDRARSRFAAARRLPSRFAAARRARSRFAAARRLPSRFAAARRARSRFAAARRARSCSRRRVGRSLPASESDIPRSGRYRTLGERRPRPRRGRGPAGRGGGGSGRGGRARRRGAAGRGRRRGRRERRRGRSGGAGGAGGAGGERNAPGRGSGADEAQARTSGSSSECLPPADSEPLERIVAREARVAVIAAPAADGLVDARPATGSAASRRRSRRTTSATVRLWATISSRVDMSIP